MDILNEKMCKIIKYIIPQLFYNLLTKSAAFVIDQNADAKNTLFNKMPRKLIFPSLVYKERKDNRLNIIVFTIGI